MPRIDELTPIGELSTEAVFPIVQNDRTYKASISQIPSGGGGGASANKLIHLDSAEIGSALNMGLLSEGEIVALFMSIDTALIDVEIELPYLIDLYNITVDMGGTVTVYTVKELNEIAQQFPGYQGIKYNGFDNTYGTTIAYGVTFLFDTVDHADAFYMQMSEADLTAATIFSPAAEEVTAHLRGE